MAARSISAAGVERPLGDAPGRSGRDFTKRQRTIGGRHELAGTAEQRAIGIEAFGVFPDDQAVEARDRTRQRRPRPRRAHVGIEIERLADGARYIDPALARWLISRHAT